MELTKRQRNEIFETLELEGLTPADCELGKQIQAVGPDKVERIKLQHLLSDSFVVMSNRTVGQPGWRVTSQVFDGPKGESLGADWDGVLRHIAQWAEEVVYAAKSPDLWAELQKLPKALAAAQVVGASNTPFSAAEMIDISSRLDEIKHLVRERFELSEEQLSAIDRRLDDVQSASERLGRKDWVLLFYGALVSLFSTDAIPPTVIQTALSVALHGIAHLFGFGGPPPTIST